MFASTKLIAAFSAIAAAASAVYAAPTAVSTAVFDPSKNNIDIVFRPPITAPVAGDAWTVGSVQTVTWETKDIPPEVMNETGLILLGYIEEGSTNEHLDIRRPLATNFPIAAGEVNVTVPDVASRDDYVIVLFGDSGNASPKFSIKPAEISSDIDLF